MDLHTDLAQLAMEQAGGHAVAREARGLVDLQPELELLLQLADAYEQPNPATDKREDVDLYRYQQGATLSHHALPGDVQPDEELLRRLDEAGFIRINWRSDTYERISVTADGDEMARRVRRLDDESEPTPEEAVSLDWEEVAEPTLRATYGAWLARGAPAEGISVATVCKERGRDEADPETYRAVALLYRGDYLDTSSGLVANDAPALVTVSTKGLEVVGGWPATTAEAASHALLAALDQEIAATDDKAERGRLQRLREAAVEVGTGTLTQVLSHIVKGEI